MPDELQCTKRITGSSLFSLILGTFVAAGSLTYISKLRGSNIQAVPVLNLLCMAILNVGKLVEVVL